MGFFNFNKLNKISSNENEIQIKEFEKEISEIKTRAIQEGKLVYENGKFQYALAPNGNKSSLTERQWLHVQSSNFKNWFGGSIFVDENSEPIIAYHGTNKKFEKFVEQKKEKQGFWFATNIEIAKKAADSRGGVIIYPVFLKITNPELAGENKNNLNDGLINYVDGFIKVINANQIKSAESNSGLYSKNSININE